MKHRADVTRFLIIRTDRIGDVILSTPVLTALKRTYPGCFTAMLLRPYTAALVEGHPDVDLILTESEPEQSIRSLAAMLRVHRFDAVVLLHPTMRLALACRLAGIPIRVGSGYRAYSYLFNRRVRQHRKNSERHELDLNMQMVHILGVKETQPIEFHVTIPPQAVQRVDDLLQQQGITARQRFVVLHPGSGGSALDWPLASYAQVATRLYEQLRVEIVITGSAEESFLIDEVVEQTDCPIHRLDGQLTIKELAALLQRASLQITNSTGPLHLAVALGVEVIGLYCPISACSPARWGPYHRPDSVLMPQVPLCERCDKEGCRYLDCMELVSVQQVFDLAAQKLLHHDPTAH